MSDLQPGVYGVGSSLQELGRSVVFVRTGCSGPSFTLLILCHLLYAVSDTQTQESRRVVII